MNPSGGTGRLFRFVPGGALHCMDAGFLVSNGIGWSPDDRTMYFVDSFRHAIFAYDFDPACGAISSRRVFADTTGEPGVPDGLTVDSQGGVWCAFCGGWKAARYTPGGVKALEIRLPVECPTSLAFGGPALDRLYITSSWGLIKQTDRKEQPQAGDLFSVETGFHGLPEPAFKDFDG
jgi:sugar lactone lactonase YvrE